MRLLFVLIVLFLTACDSSDNVEVKQVDSHERLSDSELQKIKTQGQLRLNEQPPHTYYFGFDLRSSPQEDVAQYLPFLNYLEAETGYQFKLHFTPKGSTAADELGQNHSQFAAMGAVSFLYAQTRYGAKLLVRGLNAQGKAEYQSVFVVKPDSAIQNIKEIKSRKLAFGSRDSTQGHLIPRIVLLKNGISLDQLKTYHYTGSHQNCAETVVSGKDDVCAMQEQLAQELVSRDLLKIIYRSDTYPSSGIVANQSVPEAVAERVKQALLRFEPQGKDAQGLYHWSKTEMPGGFTIGRSADYDSLRIWTTKLGFLKQKWDRESAE